MEGTKIHLCKCFFLSTNNFDHISKNIVAQTSLQQVQKLQSHAACQHIWQTENKTWTGHMIAMSQGFNRISKCKINSLTNILLYLVYSNQCFASPAQTWQQISMHGRIVDLQRLSFYPDPLCLLFISDIFLLLCFLGQKHPGNESYSVQVILQQKILQKISPGTNLNL